MHSKLSFKAWDFEDKQMLDVDSIHFRKDGSCYVKCGVVTFNINDESPLLQSTGRKDIYGKLEFEGDILSQETDYEHEEGPQEEMRTVVKWNNETSSFICADSHTKWGGDMEEFEEAEIIGNIYQHPHLITQTKEGTA